VLGLGFGLPGISAIQHFAEHGTVWTLMGFPTYGEGPFENVGIETTTPLLVGFLVVCALEVVVSVLLWAGRRSGAVLSLVLLPVEMIFWIGFALPFGPVLGLLRTVPVVVALREGKDAGWSRLSESNRRPIHYE
jgi:hypothetical protein